MGFPVHLETGLVGVGVLGAGQDCRRDRFVLAGDPQGRLGDELCDGGRGDGLAERVLEVLGAALVGAVLTGVEVDQPRTKVAWSTKLESAYRS